MKIQNLTQITSLAALLLLVLLSGSVMAQTADRTVAPGRVDPIKRPNNRGVAPDVDPKVAKGLAAVAAAAGTTVWVTNTNRQDNEEFAFALFTGADQLTASNTLRIGAIYVSRGSDQLPAGYYVVELQGQLNAVGSMTAKRVYGLTLVESSVRPDGTVEGPTEKRMHKPLVITKELDKVHFVPQGGKEVLDTTTLGEDIVNIVKFAEARRGGPVIKSN